MDGYTRNTCTHVLYLCDIQILCYSSSVNKLILSAISSVVYAVFNNIKKNSSILVVKYLNEKRNRALIEN